MKPLVSDIQLCTALVSQSDIMVFSGREQLGRGKIIAITESSVQIGEKRFARASSSFWDMTVRQKKEMPSAWAEASC